MENTIDDVKRNGVVRPRFADAGREHETKNSAASFLVGAHGAEQSRGGNARPRRQRPQAANQADDDGNVISGWQAELVAEEGRGHHAPGYGFTVLIAAVFGDALEGMGESVAEIEDFPQAGLAFVAAHYARFDLRVARYQKAKRLAIQSQHLVHIFLEDREHLRVRDDGVLDDRRETAAEFTLGERAQKFRIAEDQLGWIVLSDQRLPS